MVACARSASILQKALNRRLLFNGGSSIGECTFRSIRFATADPILRRALSTRKKAGFRARAALAREWMRTHGFRLAPVNPLRRDGLMVQSAARIEQVLPDTLQPLVKPVVQARLDGYASPGGRMPLLAYLEGTEEEDVLQKLLQQYSGSIGYEFMHAGTQEERDFFVKAAETQAPESDGDTRLWCLEQVAVADSFEQLLSRRYPTCKRFSVEGLESGILAINTIIDRFATEAPINEIDCPRVVLGTLHRGRINMLHTVLQEKLPSLLKVWDPTSGPTYDDICVGHSADVISRSGKGCHVSLLAIPAHLEAMDGTIAGKVYGDMIRNQMNLGDKDVLSNSLKSGEMREFDRRSVLPIEIHGDASFCGQGIVSEVLQLSTFKGFDAGGTIHLIFNNQVGFTAETQKMRMDRHYGAEQVSDLALSIRAPVLHVNAERPLDVFKAAVVAEEYRRIFGKDIFIEICGFRRHGHNEVDEPRITNVSLYKEVDQHATTARLFLKASLSDSEKAETLLKDIKTKYENTLYEREDLAKTPTETHGDEKREWIQFLQHPSVSDGVTSVDLQAIQTALVFMSDIPDGFTLATTTMRSISKRAALLKNIRSQTGSEALVDWATAELLALSTLALEDHFCRLCGQDSRRGTFSQRHAVWHDTVSGEIHHALPPLVQVLDSPLSELGVMGFELGISLASPNFLVLWEAQFGDFVNNTQVLIDTMISSEKQKFGLESNLVLLLPHGYDGMGPEHSSCRLERFLSLHTDTPEAADATIDEFARLRNANFTVVYPTTASNYFHVLRRSFSWPFRRPMVVLTPKRTLRLPKAASPLSSFLRNGSQTCFVPVLDDPRPLEPKDVSSLVLCSGEVFYDVLRLAEKVTKSSKSVAIVRVEQLAPFPLRQLQAIVGKYPHASRAVWIQEEPLNMGAAHFTEPFLRKVSVPFDTPITRPVSAAPAVGNPRDHVCSQMDLEERITDWILCGNPDQAAA